MKVVLDTNTLIRAVPSKSNYHCIISALQQGYYNLCVSTEILLEYEELLTRFYGRSITESVMGFIIHSPYTERINPAYLWHLIFADPDDNKFVDCALNCGADCIVTNDNHFNILRTIPYPPVNVIDIDAFKQMLNEK
jgi:putative PIN family toxin of toxin-antitoxin system